MLGELIPCGGGDPIPLLKPVLLVGRRSKCDITLRFPNVSSHHCNLELLNGYWLIRDLGSRNGIKVNGVRCDSKWLMPGDILSIAKHRFELSYTPEGDGPPPEEEDPFAIGLLEKAGLAGRETQRPAPPPRNSKRSQEETSSSRPSRAADEDDLALKWLNEEDEDDG